jgi:hypothetical protein
MRAAAIRFSSLLNQKTSCGLPKSAKQMSANTTVHEPKNMEIALQGARLSGFFCACVPMPYMICDRVRFSWFHSPQNGAGTHVNDTDHREL